MVGDEPIGSGIWQSSSIASTDAGWGTGWSIASWPSGRGASSVPPQREESRPYNLRHLSKYETITIGKRRSLFY
jgi:hypothetical protein